MYRFFKYIKYCCIKYVYICNRESIYLKFRGKRDMNDIFYNGSF